MLLFVVGGDDDRHERFHDAGVTPCADGAGPRGGNEDTEVFGIDLGAAGALGQRVITVTLTDREGRSLTGGKVAARFVRPVEKVGVVEVDLAEGMIGRYAGEVVLPARGQWDVRVLVERAGERVEARQRVFAK